MRAGGAVGGRRGLFRSWLVVETGGKTYDIWMTLTAKPRRDIRCLRNYGFVGASFPVRTATQDGYTLEPGKPVTLKFRVRVTDVER